VTLLISKEGRNREYKAYLRKEVTMSTRQKEMMVIGIGITLGLGLMAGSGYSMGRRPLEKETEETEEQGQTQKESGIFSSVFSSKESQEEKKTREEFERVKREYEDGLTRISEELTEMNKKGVFEDQMAREKYLKTEHRQKKYDLAHKIAGEYEKIVDTYPESEIADDCLFEAIKALEKIGSKTLHYATCLINEYPESVFAEFEKVKIGWEKTEQKKQPSKSISKEETKQTEAYDEEQDKAKEIIAKHETLINKYPDSEIADDCLYEIVIILAQTGGPTMKIGVPLDESYKEAMRYADRLYREYPESKLGEDAYLAIGQRWCGFIDAHTDYVDAYVELAKRYPESKYAMDVLLLIMMVSSQLSRPDAYLWAYKVLITEYKDRTYKPVLFTGLGMFAMPPEEWFPGTKKGYAEKILPDYIREIEKTLDEYKRKNGYYPKGNISDGNEFYKILLPYFPTYTYTYKKGLREFNPFYSDSPLRLSYYKSDGKEFEFELDLLELKKKVESR